MSTGAKERSMPDATGDSAIRRFLSDDLLDAVIRIALIAFLLFACLRIFTPFKNLLLWGLILAVALYPLQRRIATQLGDRGGPRRGAGRSACLAPAARPATVALSSLFAGQMHAAFEAFAADSVIITPPDPSVAAWPFIGDRLFAAWSAAATDLRAFLESLQPAATATSSGTCPCSPPRRARWETSCCSSRRSSLPGS